MNHDQREQTWGVIALLGFALLCGVALAGCADSPTGEQFCYAPDSAHSSGLGGSTQLCLGYP